MIEQGRPSSPIVGACHGFQVRSDLPISLTRSADLSRPMSTLDVCQATHPLPEPEQTPVREWVSSPGKPFSARLHQLGDGYGMWIDGFGAYAVNVELPQITVPAELPPARWESRLWGIPAVLCFAALGDLSLHAAVADVGGSAVILVGPGRFGKTTLAAAFLQAGHRVLAEDLCRCAVEPVPVVYPGPAMLRMRRDSFQRLGDFPGTSVGIEEDDRVHLVLDPSFRGGGQAVPIKAIITLQVSSGLTTLERLDPTMAIPLLWATSFNLPEPDDRSRCFLGVAGLASRVPIWRLTRQLNYDELPGLVDRIVTTCLS